MNILSRLPVFLFLGFVTGCANPGQSYASQHPELSAVHRQILSTGKIPNGDGVAGMTRDQVRLAMGRDPAVLDKINGEDASVYVHRKSTARNPGAENPPMPSSSFDAAQSSAQPDRFRSGMDVEVRTTIFFAGGRATHAQTSEERP